MIRDLKIIQGAKGAFVAMPSRKLSDRCPKCHAKNQIRASYCNQCGVKLHPERAHKDETGRSKLYADIAHPINSSCREMIQKRVIAAFEEELIRAQRDDYVCSYDDYEEERFARLNESESFSQTAENKKGTSDTHPEQSVDAASVPAGTTMNLETEDGRLLRVDSRSGHEANSSDDRQDSGKRQHQETSSSTEDSFGDGII